MFPLVRRFFSSMASSITPGYRKLGTNTLCLEKLTPEALKETTEFLSQEDTFHTFAPKTLEVKTWLSPEDRRFLVRAITESHRIRYPTTVLKVHQNSFSPMEQHTLQQKGIRVQESGTPDEVSASLPDFSY